jgi:hypothetical protein
LVLAALFTTLSFNAPVLHAAEAEKGPKPQAFMEPEAAPVEFHLQGEYVGEVGGKKLACQAYCIAPGIFKLAFFDGGLPGDGGDSATRAEVDGKLAGEKVEFTGADSYSGTITKEAFNGKTAKGDAFELKKVTRKSPTEGAKPPEGALVLFDGSSTDAFTDGTAAAKEAKMDANKHLMCGAETKKKDFKNFTLHVEFRVPFKPAGKAQDRCNSGVYIQRSYEIQILDSFGVKQAQNDCASVYTRVPPKINMTFPPLAWQTYDIEFKAAKYDADGKKIGNASVSVKHNGVQVHENQEILKPTGAGQPEKIAGGPLYFQDHGNPVIFRNIWVVEQK